MEPKVAKRGRPPKFAGQRTRGPLTVRLRDEVRLDLEKSSAANGRSLSEEIEHRLELSLATRDRLIEEWGRDAFGLAEAMARSLYYIESAAQADWIADDTVFDIFRRTALILINQHREMAQRFASGRLFERPIPFEIEHEDPVAADYAAFAWFSPPTSRTAMRASFPELSRDEQRWKDMGAKLRNELAQVENPARRAHLYDQALEALSGDIVHKRGGDTDHLYLYFLDTVLKYFPRDPAERGLPHFTQQGPSTPVKKTGRRA